MRSWIMYLSLLGALLFSLAAGMVLANRIVQRPNPAASVVPAIQQQPGSSVCPAQSGGCPASGKRAAAHLQV